MGSIEIAPAQSSGFSMRLPASVFSKDMLGGIILRASFQSVHPSSAFLTDAVSSSSSGVVKQMYVRTAPSMSPRTSLSPTRCVTGRTTPNLWTPK